MTRTNDRRPAFLFTALAVLALTGAILALIFSSVEAQEGEGQEDSPPTKPTGLSAQAFHDHVDLTWDDPQDDGITGYQVFRRDRDTQDPGEFTLIEDDTGSADTSHTDTGVEPETRYVYRVKAVNEHGASRWSDYVNADTPPAPEPTPDPTPEPNTPATGTPAISGTPRAGETLTADTSGIADADGLDNAVFSYQWTAGGADISGATNSTHTLADADRGKAIRVKVSFTDDRGNDETLTSAATAEVAARPNSPATGRPTITGATRVEETLTVDTSGIDDEDGLDNAVFSYQWLAGDADISGATNSTHTLAEADEGRTVRVRVSFTDDRGNDETLTSVATAEVAAAPSAEPPAQPTGLEAEASHDQVVLTWNDPQDDAITGYVILRRNRNTDAEGQFTTLAPDTGTAETTHTDDTVEAETPYTYRIKAINEHGMSERSRWVHLDTPALPKPRWPTGLSAQASHDSVVLTWDDPDDGSITGYAVFRRNPDIHALGEFITLVESTGTAATTHTDASVAPETPYIYRVQAINASGTSPRSDWVRADTPAPPIPAEPTGLAAAASHNAVILTWNDPQDDTITGYVILRRNPNIHAEGDFITLAEDTGTAATTHTDHTVKPETPYTYRIKAINAAGMSGRSRWVHTETPAAPAAQQQTPGADDFPASTATTGQLTPGPTVQSVVGTIETDGDVDWVLIQAQHGQWYTLSVAGYAEDGHSPVATPYQKEYYQLDGELQVPEYALNKGAPHCTEDCSHVMVSRGGPRYLAVAARNGNTGSYRVTVTLERHHEGTEGGGSDMGDHTGTQGFLDMLTTGEFPGFNPAWNRLFGSITAGDSDWYRIEMEAGQGYYFRLRDQESDLLLRLRDSGGNVLSTVQSWRYMRAMACAEGPHYLEVYRPDGAATHTTGYVVEAQLTPGLGMRPLRGVLLNTGQVQLDWQCYRLADSHQVQFRLNNVWTTLEPGDGNPAGIGMSRLNDGFTAKMAGLPATDDYPEYRFRIRPVVNGAAMLDHRTVSIVVIPDAPGNLRGGWSYRLYPDGLTMEWDKVEGDNVDYEVQIRDQQDQRWVDLGLDPPPGVIHHRDTDTRVRILAASPRYVALVSPHGYAAEHVLMRVRATQYGRTSPWTRPFEALFADQAWVGVGSLEGALSQAGQATLSWGSPAYIGEGSFNLETTYVLYRMDGEWTHLLPGHDVNGVTIEVSSGGAVVSGLPEGRAEYQFSVRHFGSNRHDHASSTLLLSPWSRTLTITTGLQRPERPEAAQTAIGQVSLSWGEVEQAARYRLRLWMEDRWVELDGDHGTGVAVAMSGTTANVSGLPDDRYWYIFEVKALGQSGVQQSGWSPNIAVFNQHRSGGQ